MNSDIEIDKTDVLSINQKILYTVLFLFYFIISVLIFTNDLIGMIISIIFWPIYLSRKRETENFFIKINLSILFSSIIIISLLYLSLIIFKTELDACDLTFMDRNIAETCFGYTKFITRSASITPLSLFSIPAISLSSLILLYFKPKKTKVKISTMKFASHILGISLLLGLIFTILRSYLPKF